MREVQRQIDAAEFAEWMAYDRINPIGGDRHDFLGAQIAYVTANAWSSKRIPFESFIPPWTLPPVRVMSPKEVERKIISIVTMGRAA